MLERNQKSRVKGGYRWAIVGLKVGSSMSFNRSIVDQGGLENLSYYILLRNIIRSIINKSIYFALLALLPHENYHKYRVQKRANRNRSKGGLSFEQSKQRECKQCIKN